MMFQIYLNLSLTLKKLNQNQIYMHLF
ncbi:type VI secretion system tube protein [Staphylococcus phage JPL-50]|uniref:Type VI secretion system tube protein n=1 Tax=Staphylococcus phage JPL-50 TaxID=2851077 RepID=A0A8F3HMA5_9CAUD|nr:type VI secretion system tube protein [Staphylococcus phage JPL-50]QWY14502.1 type VI secretion system tube protein [Staphylococcus phage JPL-50]